jgi:hypothetical protein
MTKFKLQSIGAPWLSNFTETEESNKVDCLLQHRSTDTVVVKSSS